MEYGYSNRIWQESLQVSNGDQGRCTEKWPLDLVDEEVIRDFKEKFLQ